MSANDNQQLKKIQSEQDSTRPMDAKRMRKLIIWTAVPIVVFILWLIYITHAFNW